MFLKLTIAFSLLGLCVMIHAAGLTVLLTTKAGVLPAAGMRPLRAAVFLVQTAICLLVLHLIEIYLWGVAYYLFGCLPDLEVALYFSGSTYSTVGYGDVVLPREWWFLGPIEGLTGILLCGLSTGYFFVVLTKLFERLLPQPPSGGSPG